MQIKANYYQVRYFSFKLHVLINMQIKLITTTTFESDQEQLLFSCAPGGDCVDFFLSTFFYVFKSASMEWDGQVFQHEGSFVNFSFFLHVFIISILTCCIAVIQLAGQLWHPAKWRSPSFIQSDTMWYLLFYINFCLGFWHSLQWVEYCRQFLCDWWWWKTGWQSGGYFWCFLFAFDLPISRVVFFFIAKCVHGRLMVNGTGWQGT